MTTVAQTTASICVRLSKQAGETNLSLAGMLDDCRALAERLGCTVVNEWVDDGVSGTVRDRAGFIGWLTDAVEERADLLIAPTTDRLTREGVQVIAKVLDVLEGRDLQGRPHRTPVRLVTVDGLDSSSEFRWQFVIQAEVARAELARIAARNKSTRARMVKAGRWPGGQVPYGCRVVTRDGLRYLEAEPAEADILREAARKLIAGTATRAVAKSLVDQGTTPRHGTVWTSQQLKTVLSCAASRRHVLSPATWRALQVRLAPKANTAQQGRPQKFLLTKGGGVCGSCRRNLLQRRRRYLCDRLDCPSQVSIDATAVDAHLEAEFLALHGDERYWETHVDLGGLEAVEAALQGVEAAQADLLADPTADRLDALLQAREAHSALLAEPVETHRYETPSGQTVAERWQADAPTERGVTLRHALLGPVVVQPSTVEGKRRVGLDRLTYEWAAPFVNFG